MGERKSKDDKHLTCSFNLYFNSLYGNHYIPTSSITAKKYSKFGSLL